MRFDEQFDHDSDDLDYEDWDEKPEEERAAADHAAVDAAISALQSWRGRAEWRNAEADHFNKIARDAVAKSLPLGDLERQELVQLREENAKLLAQISYLSNAVLLLQTKPRTAGSDG